MQKRRTYETKIVEEFIPENDALEEGVLYVAPHFDCAVHKCMCGCGEVVCTPLGEGKWSWCKDGTSGNVSLSPSIGNFDYKCKSHYFLRNGIVQWC